MTMRLTPSQIFNYSFLPRKSLQETQLAVINVKENLVAARAKIADSKNWIRGTPARDALGWPVSSDSKSACKYCGVGALLAVSPLNNKDLFKNSYAALVASSDALYSERNVAKVNDALGHEAILWVYDRAISNASEGYGIS